MIRSIYVERHFAVTQDLNDANQEHHHLPAVTLAL
jgi:hypothetical protein